MVSSNRNTLYTKYIASNSCDSSRNIHKTLVNIHYPHIISLSYCGPGLENGRMIWMTYKLQTWMFIFRTSVNPVENIAYKFPAIDFDRSALSTVIPLPHSFGLPDLVQRLTTTDFLVLDLISKKSTRHLFRTTKKLSPFPKVFIKKFQRNEVDLYACPVLIFIQLSAGCWDPSYGGRFEPQMYNNFLMSLMLYMTNPNRISHFS